MGGIAVKTVKLISTNATSISVSNGGAAYIFLNVGDEVSVPSSLAAMLLMPGCYLGVFAEVAP